MAATSDLTNNIADIHSPSIRDQIKKRMTPELHRAIRRLWMAHSIAEDSRDIPGLIATLTEDCVYTIVATGHAYHGHAGAEAFYTEMLTAVPDVHFALQNIVIGPQGVWEEAHVTGTWQEEWLGYPATGKPIEALVQIYFPYDVERGLFLGERVYFEAAKLLGQR